MTVFLGSKNVLNLVYFGLSILYFWSLKCPNMLLGLSMIQTMSKGSVEGKIFASLRVSSIQKGKGITCTESQKKKFQKISIYSF